ncbi:MAG TPA: hypothetical protein VK619_05250 [Pyrinomonadaceae bacterium]|nr:hypothetical protein [Pyrinomonadaceae bacterium]
MSAAAERKIETEADSSIEKRPATASSYIEGIKESLGEAWIPRIYSERIMTIRTRAHHLKLPLKTGTVEIQHTLLGIELKVGRMRMHCPDLATARYLSTFARAGCTDVAVPYDITRISTLADELESSWQRMLLLVEHLAAGRSPQFRSRVRALLSAEVKREITEAGAGAAMPVFNQNTKQRRTS